MSDCLFCKISKGEIPADIVFKNGKVIAFNDINPCAKIHILFIHREHTKNISELSVNNPEQLADVFQAITQYAKENGLAKDGFRIVTNQGPNSGQAIYHTHFHVLGGEKLSAGMGC
ncbi:MAG: histidine triad nucleotide-binding protein [Bacteriovoracia bacterium]